MLNKYWIELKYILLAILLLGGLWLLHHNDALAGLNGSFNDLMTFLSRLGFIGMFILAIIGNSSLLVQVPYTVPLVSIALTGSSLSNLLFLGLGAGLGAGFGEIISYLIADKVLAFNPDLPSSSLYQWVNRQVKSRPRFIPWLIFIWAASFLPDDTVLIPLALIRYGLRRIAIPLFLGKVVHNLIFALTLYYATEQVSGQVSTEVQTDLALGILIAFLLFIFYQVEKTKQIVAYGTAHFPEVNE